MGIKISYKINFIGIFTVVAGILINLWFLTVGLYITLWAYDTSKEITTFLFLICGIAFGLMLLLGGVGVLRRRSLSRVLLIVSFYLASAGIIWYLFLNIIQGLKEMRYKSFDVSSWIGGIVFCLFAGILFVFQAVFLNRPDVKELFK